MPYQFLLHTLYSYQYVYNSLRSMHTSLSLTHTHTHLPDLNSKRRGEEIELRLTNSGKTITFSVTHSPQSVYDSTSYASLCVPQNYAHLIGFAFLQRL
ncbi:hypothetical protein KP509_32G036600 [Ceratopteris richardii]|uniref:Uncharacterized protein n=1 Tax=Ceratopteris richardii TaxID=49495 RepID=A0A8T2QU40_CERRI|nr:hypothetical protein KP509_32G036600 [Ceratopteris richardii]